MRKNANLLMDPKTQPATLSGRSSPSLISPAGDWLPRSELSGRLPRYERRELFNSECCIQHRSVTIVTRFGRGEITP